jgi:hypothetical protein
MNVIPSVFFSADNADEYIKIFIVYKTLYEKTVRDEDINEDQIK